MTPTRDDLIANIVRLLERHNSNHETVEALAEKICALLPLLEPVGEEIPPAANVVREFLSRYDGTTFSDDALEELLNERDALFLAHIKSRAGQQRTESRTPGTDEVCGLCGTFLTHDAAQRHRGSVTIKCRHEDCPIRTKGASNEI